MMRRPVEPMLTEYLHTKASRLGIPLNGTFELTPLCNMNCRMCYVRMDREQQESIAPLRTAEEWLELGRTAKERGMTYLLLTGGEPFLRPDFRQIMQGLHRMGFVMSINSNGTLIDESTVEWLKETPPVRINITLYGASDETYGRLCRNPRGFTQVTKAIRLLKEAGILVKLNCSVTPHNAGDLEQIFAFAEKEGLVVQATSYMFPPLRRDASKVGWNDRFSPEESARQEAWISVYQHGREAWLEHMESDEMTALSGDIEEDCMPLEEEPSEKDGKIEDAEGEQIRCRAGKCSFWVTWDGRVLPCGMLLGEHTLNVFETGFDAAWEQARAEAAAIRLPVKCSTCSLKEKCRACAAMVYTESGNYHEVPEYRCRLAHCYAAACRQVEGEIRQEARK